MVRIHRGDDPWGRGSYSIPSHAVMGSSDTGTYSDSPCPSNLVAKELYDFRTVLKMHGIDSKFESTQSGNLFMVKLWVVVDAENVRKARQLAKRYLKKHDRDTQFIHDAKA